MNTVSELWKKYNNQQHYNIDILPEEIKNKGVYIRFSPGMPIVNQGDSPEFIYFILSGICLGTREYSDGNRYLYFTEDRSKGALGLLEILAQKPEIVATVIAKTEVEALKINSAIIYNHIMNSPQMLQCCIRQLANDFYNNTGEHGILYYLRGIDRVRYHLAKYYEHHSINSESVLIDEEYLPMANSIGISVRTVVRSIAELKKRGEITSINKRIYISEKQYQDLIETINPLL